MLDLQIMLIMTVRRHASEKLIGLDMRANNWPVSSRTTLRRSLHRLNAHGVLVHDRTARVWALVSYESAQSWCNQSRAALEEQERMLHQTEGLLREMALSMEQLADQVASKGAWHGRWIKQSKGT